MKPLNVLIALILFSQPLLAEASPTPMQITAEVVTIKLKDGSTLVARIVSQDGDLLRIVTVGGVAMEIPRTSVLSIASDEPAEGPARPWDVNDTRLLFSPTGRPLPKGTGYFSDHFLVFPGVAYGITDNLSIGAGISVVPGLGLNEQLLYVAPRLGKRFSDNLALSGGLLYAHVGNNNDEGNLGVAYAMATFGKPDKSLTLGAGVARTIDHETVSRNQVSHTPVVMIGGTARLSHRIAFVSENWLVLNEDFKLSQQPFGLGVRFLGESLSADVGVILVGELLDEGFPIPWVSVSYHFGRRK